MNNTFNIQRFGLLLKRQWLEFGKIYLIGLIVALGIITAFYTLSLWPSYTNKRSFEAHDLNFREPLFLIFGFIFISIIASSYFAHLGQKPKAIIDLMIPASTFEKFLTGIFFTAILATASFIILFYLTDLAFISNLRASYHSTTSPAADGSTIDHMTYFFTKNNPNAFKPLYPAPFFVTSVFLLGSIYFNKFHYIKTAISVMIFSGIWTYIVYKFGELLFANKVSVHNGHMSNSRNNAELWTMLLLVLLTLVFWSITYVRLKEKEV